MKIDVEGYELKVLRGARMTISQFRPRLIQFEYFTDYPLLPRSEWPALDDYRSFFKEAGYEGFFCMGRRTGRLEPLVEKQPQDNDLFCIEGSYMDQMRRNGLLPEH
jgi:hypothetical protein